MKLESIYDYILMLIPNALKEKNERMGKEILRVTERIFSFLESVK